MLYKQHTTPQRAPPFCCAPGSLYLLRQWRRVSPGTGRSTRSSCHCSTIHCVIGSVVSHCDAIMHHINHATLMPAAIASSVDRARPAVTSLVLTTATLMHDLCCTGALCGQLHSQGRHGPIHTTSSRSQMVAHAAASCHGGQWPRYNGAGAAASATCRHSDAPPHMM